MILTVMKEIYAIADIKACKKSGLQPGFEPVTLRYPCDTLTNCVMKPLTLGAGHLWVQTSLRGMNVEVGYDIFHTLNCGCGCESKQFMDLH